MLCERGRCGAEVPNARLWGRYPDCYRGSCLVSSCDMRFDESLGDLQGPGLLLGGLPREATSFIHRVLVVLLVFLRLYVDLDIYIYI